MAQRRDWLKGGIESLILYLISQRPMYGYQIIRELEGRSNGYFNFKEGTLYPVLHRLEHGGLLLGQWQRPHTGRHRKYYHITDRGLAIMAERKSQLQALLAAINMIIQPQST